MKLFKNYFIVLYILTFISFFVLGCRRQPISENESQKLEIVSTNTKYPINNEMRKDAKKKEDSLAVNFTVPVNNGKSTSLKKLVQKGPVVIIAIKEGCPCNLRAQPLFNHLSKKFEGKATFIGIINADHKAAEEFTKETKTNFPIISDLNLELLNAYKFERSAYTILVDKNQKILKAWPGYSQDMLKELNSLLAQQCKVKDHPFNTKYAPKDMTSGCLFK